ncbi:unnamed protein product [Chironomus riparius]|uniref:Uncharacterized protein n=1 Tax=Chironomus riparius TaxID=315576 RepID=A0A9N9RNI3_9DIPT|nr:unnamed protein product [Chironomus riparius]
MRMKLEFNIFILPALILVLNHANCAPLDAVEVTKQTFNKFLNQGYNFLYSLSDGQTREETGTYDENGNLKIKGSYSYNGDDNKKYKVQYTADENGYQAQSEVEEIVIPISTPPNLQLSAAAIATLSVG